MAEGDGMEAYSVLVGNGDDNDQQQQSQQYLSEDRGDGRVQSEMMSRMGSMRRSKSEVVKVEERFLEIPLARCCGYYCCNMCSTVENEDVKVVCTNGRCCFLLLFFWIFLATIIPNMWYKALDDAVYEELVIDSPLAKSYDAFVSDENARIQDRVEIKFFLFHVTNPKDVIDRGEPPHVMELGPFTYKVATEHHNITWSSDKDDVFYVDWQRYIFDPSKSITDDDKLAMVTSVNIPFQILVAVANTIGGKDLVNFLVGLLFNANLKYPKDYIFTTKSVRDHLFGYYDDEFADNLVVHTIISLLSMFLHKPVDFYPAFVQNYSSPVDVFKTNGYNALHTGRRDRKKMRHALWYHNSSTIPQWNSHQARMVKGSDGHFFGREEVDSGKPLTVWLPELLRHARITYTGKKERINGITTEKYEIAKDTFQNALLYPKNADYYSFGPNGLFNISIHAGNTPLFVSKPHFLDGDEFLWKAIHGLTEPDRELHDIQYHIHHCTGVGFQVSQRFQYNVRLDPLKDLIPTMPPSTYIPIFWMETIDQISRSHEHSFKRADEIDEFVGWIKAIGKYAGIVCLICLISLSIMTQHDQLVLEERLAHLDEAWEDHHQSSGETPDIRVLDPKGKLIREWISFVLFCFAVNVVVGYATWTVDTDEIEVWKLDPQLHTSATFQYLTTMTFVGLFACITGTLAARKEIVRYSREEIRIMDSALLEGAKNHPCQVGWLFAAIAVVCFGTPALLIQYLAVCGPYHHHCRYSTWTFILSKAGIAAFEATVVFYVAATYILKRSLR